MAKVPFTLRIEEDLLKKIKRDALEHEISISSEIELRIIGSLALSQFQNSFEDTIEDKDDDFIFTVIDINKILCEHIIHLKKKYNLW